jgi:hypothetical protein
MNGQLIQGVTSNSLIHLRPGFPPVGGFHYADGVGRQDKEILGILRIDRDLGNKKPLGWSRQGSGFQTREENPDQKENKYDSARRATGPFSTHHLN